MTLRTILGMTLLAVGAGATAAANLPSSKAEFGGQCPEALSEGDARGDQLLRHLGRQGWQDLLLQQRGRQEVVSCRTRPKSSRARARFMAAGNVEATETAMQNFAGSDAEALVKRVHQRQAQGEQRHVPDRGPAQRRAPEARLRRHRFHPHHRRLRLFSGRQIPRCRRPEKEIPDRFLGRAGERAAADPGDAHLQGSRCWSTAHGPRWPASPFPGGGSRLRSIPATWPRSAAGKSCRRSSRHAVQARPRRQRRLQDQGRQDRQGAGAGIHRHPSAGAPARQRRPLLRLHRFSRGRHQGSKSTTSTFGSATRTAPCRSIRRRCTRCPSSRDGQWIQVPRYEWKDLGSSHVVP